MGPRLPGRLDEFLHEPLENPELEAGLGSSVPTALFVAAGRRNSLLSTFLGDARAFLAKPWL